MAQTIQNQLVTTIASGSLILIGGGLIVTNFVAFSLFYATVGSPLFIIFFVISGLLGLAIAVAGLVASFYYSSSKFKTVQQQLDNARKEGAEDFCRYLKENLSQDDTRIDQLFGEMKDILSQPILKN